MNTLLTKLVFFFISWPIFITYNLKVLNEETEKAQVLPLSIYLLSGLLLFNIKHIRYQKNNYIDMLFISALLIMTMSLLLSSIFITNNIQIKMFLLYTLPMIIGFSSGKLITAKKLITDNIFYYIFLGAGVFCAFHLLYGISKYGIMGMVEAQGTDNFWNLFTIYQKYVSVPLVLSIVLFLSSLFKSTPQVLLLRAALIIEIIILAAREAVLAIFFMWIISYLLSFKRISSQKNAVFSLLAILVLMILFMQFIDTNELWIVKKIFSLVENDLTGGREEQLQMGWNYIVNDLNFIIGEGFGLSDEFPEGTYHNQWIEFFVKGGISTLSIMIFLFFISIKKSISQSNRKKPTIRLIGIILIMLVFISFNINTPVRTPYSSIFIWFFVGLISSTNVITAYKSTATPKVRF